MHDFDTVLFVGAQNRTVHISYCTLKLFNLNRLRARTKISTTTVVELQYADDNVLAKPEEDLQTTLNAFRQAYESIGLELNTDKTKIL